MTIALVLQYSNKGAQMKLHNYTNKITLEQIPHIRVKTKNIHVKGTNVRIIYNLIITFVTNVMICIVLYCIEAYCYV